MEELRGKSGIYQIRNLLNNKIYVGSAIDFFKRRQLHFGDLRRLKHRNRILQNCVNKHGTDVFIFEVLEFVPNKLNLLSREQFYIDSLNPYYNIFRSSAGGYKWEFKTSILC